MPGTVCLKTGDFDRWSLVSLSAKVKRLPKIQKARPQMCGPKTRANARVQGLSIGTKMAQTKAQDTWPTLGGWHDTHAIASPELVLFFYYFAFKRGFPLFSTRPKLSHLFSWGPFCPPSFDYQGSINYQGRLFSTKRTPRHTPLNGRGVFLPWKNDRLSSEAFLGRPFSHHRVAKRPPG